MVRWLQRTPKKWNILNLSRNRQRQFASVEISSIFVIKSWRTFWVTCATVSKPGCFSTRFTSGTKSVTAFFNICISGTNNLFSDPSQSLKNSIAKLRFWREFFQLKRITTLEFFSQPESAQNPKFFVCSDARQFMYGTFTKSPKSNPFLRIDYSEQKNASITIGRFHCHAIKKKSKTIQWKMLWNYDVAEDN